MGNVWSVILLHDELANPHTFLKPSVVKHAYYLGD